MTLSFGIGAGGNRQGEKGEAHGLKAPADKVTDPYTKLSSDK